MITIRDPAQSDEAAWRSLWAGYQAFYETTLPEAVTAATWRRILDPAAPVFARLAVQGGGVLGFAAVVLHDNTWTLSPVCYLEDLFVAEAARNQGVGKALIQDLVDRGRAAGWARLYWHTRKDNPARRLYDGFIEADDFVRYRMTLD